MVHPLLESHLRGRSPLHFHCACGFATQRLAHMLDSLVRVSRRAREDDFLRIATAHERVPRREQAQTKGAPAKRRAIRTSVGPRVGVGGLRPREQALVATSPLPVSPDPNRPGASRAHKSGQQAARRTMDPPTTHLHGFPLSNFKYFLTLFSKFFASFPHGTCSLSVSRQYLALDGIYHPLRAALPSNSTLRKRLVHAYDPAADGILTLSDTLFQGIYAGRRDEDSSSRLQFGGQRPQIFKLSSSRFTRRY